MTQKTRAQLKTAKNLLLDPAQPKLSKVNHAAFLEDVFDSVPTVLDDAPLWMRPVIGFQNSPPGLFGIGDRYLVGASPSSAWSGQALKLAVFDGSTWVFTTVTDRSVFPSSASPNSYFVKEGAAIVARQWSKSTVSRLPGDITSFSNVLDSITASRMPLRATYSYKLSASLLLRSTGTGTGIWVSLNADDAVDIVSWKLTTINAAGAEVVQRSNAFLGGSATDGVPAANTTYLVTLEAVLHNPSVDTQVYLMMASGTDGQGVRMMTGTFLELTSFQ